MCDPVCRGPCGVHCFFGLLAGVGVAVAGGRTAAVRVPLVCAFVVCVLVVVCVVSQLTSINPTPNSNGFKVEICIADHHRTSMAST
jgi:hypothetical protein